MSDKPILCLDFDGVLHSYTSRWKGADVIPDPMVPGAATFLREAVKHFRIMVFSTRSNQDGGIDAMRTWMEREIEAQSNGSEPQWPSTLIAAIEFPLTKPPALISIDDRAITFTGTWPDVDALRAFRPWNKDDRPMRALGCVLRQLWVHPLDWSRVKAYATRLAGKRCPKPTPQARHLGVRNGT